MEFILIFVFFQKRMQDRLQDRQKDTEKYCNPNTAY